MLAISYSKHAYWDNGFILTKSILSKAELVLLCLT